MAHAHEALVLDLIARTERSLESIARLAVDTGITFAIDDVVDAVERDLPAVYPAPTKGAASRRDFIAQLAQSILSGEMYTDS